jgi:hypothetical protein
MIAGRGAGRGGLRSFASTSTTQQARHSTVLVLHDAHRRQQADARASPLVQYQRRWESSAPAAAEKSSSVDILTERLLRLNEKKKTIEDEEDRLRKQLEALMGSKIPLAEHLEATKVAMETRAAIPKFDYFGKPVVKEGKKGKGGKAEALALPPLGQRVREGAAAAVVYIRGMRMKSMWATLKHEVKHYWVGFKLLIADSKTAYGIFGLTLQGRSLTRRQRKLLVKTTGDLFRLLPTLVFILVPLGELLIPFALKIFPDMLPSHFKHQSQEKAKKKQQLKARMEYARSPTFYIVCSI